MEEKILKFPEGFLWGSSISAYQTEGGIKNCDWSNFKDAGIACDFYHKYEEDFSLLEKLNQNSLRFSIEWSRIEPEEGKFDKNEIEHYKKVLSALKKRKIKSVVTLWHWTLPLWLANIGGWSNKQSIDFFARYTKTIVEELGHLVDIWVVLNEPLAYIRNGYLIGTFSPGQKNIFEAILVFQNLTKAHIESYKIIHEKFPGAKVGIAQLANFFEPASQWNPLEQMIVFLGKYFWNDYFIKRINNFSDYIGIDYYFYQRIVFYPPFIKNINAIVSDLGWEVYPKGIYFLLKDFAKFRKPIYILENGLADAEDELRKNFIKDHLYWIYRAIEEGVNVRGYFHWSLMDNFEWNKGFEPRFGLAEIDYKTLERKLRPSAFYYAQICKENSLICG
jgi:beta-glucosidase